jgi:predicted transcriptional regulator of viral defense system
MSRTHPAARWQPIFQTHGGLLTAREARALGLHPQRLARLVERGEVERLERGVYRLIDEETAFGSAEEYLEVQLRVPHARPCLVSALHLHGLTTTRPPRLQFAVPRHRSVPKLEASPVEVFYFGKAAYNTGVATRRVAQRTLTTYTPEKTLADLLRYASKLGRDVYLEGLKNYLRERRRQGTRALLDMARAMNVEAALRRDLEVLLHESER